MHELNDYFSNNKFFNENDTYNAVTKDQDNYLDANLEQCHIDLNDETNQDEFELNYFYKNKEEDNLSSKDLANNCLSNEYLLNGDNELNKNESNYFDNKLGELTGLELVPYQEEDEDNCLNNNDNFVNEFDLSHFKENAFNNVREEEEGDLLEIYKNEFKKNFPNLFKAKKSKKVNIKD